MQVRAVVLSLGFLLLLVGLPVRSAAAADTFADFTFHLTLTPPPTPLGAWTVAGTSASPVHRTHGPEIVDGDAAGRLASVTSWTPGANQLALTLYFTNLSKLGAADSTLVVDMISPAWDSVLDPAGGFVLGTSAYGSNGYMFDEHIDAGSVPAAGGFSVPLTLGIGSPGAPPAPRYDLFYHVETGPAAAIVRQGLPYEGTLPRMMSKLLPPPPGRRYIALDTIDPSSPDRWADRFEAKYDLHPAVYEFIGSLHSIDSQSLQGYVDSIKLAAARGMVPGIQLGMAGPADPGSWTYQEIIDGVHDQFITQLATTIRDLGYPVVGFLGEEFNKSGDRDYNACGADGKSGCSGNSTYTASDADAYGDPTYPDAPERFRDAARHIVDLFNEVGATNVTYAIMPNNASYDVPPFPFDEQGSGDAWSDEVKYYYPGRDYVDIGASQNYWSYPNPAGVPFAYPSVPDQWARHHNGYQDWQSVDPSLMWAQPDDLQLYGTYPAAGKDRSPLIRSWYAAMPLFPNARYFAVYDNGVENGICAQLAGYCLANPAVFNATGLGDYGFFHPEEIDTFRAGEPAAGFTGAPVLSADVTAPAKVADLSAEPGPVPGTVTLTWTAPGDDGFAGTADHYTLKYRTDANLTASTWSRYETRFVTPPAPAPGGTVQSYTVTGLPAGTYTFGIKATDPVEHTAPVSNVATVAVTSGAAPGTHVGGTAAGAQARPRATTPELRAARLQPPARGVLPPAALLILLVCATGAWLLLGRR